MCDHCKSPNSRDSRPVFTTPLPQPSTAKPQNGQGGCSCGDAGSTGGCCSWRQSCCGGGCCSALPDCCAVGEEKKPVAREDITYGMAYGYGPEVGPFHPGYGSSVGQGMMPGMMPTMGMGMVPGMQMGMAPGMGMAMGSGMYGAPYAASDQLMGAMPYQPDRPKCYGGDCGGPLSEDGSNPEMVKCGVSSSTA